MHGTFATAPRYSVGDVPQALDRKTLTYSRLIIPHFHRHVNNLSANSAFKLQKTAENQGDCVKNPLSPLFWQIATVPVNSATRFSAVPQVVSVSRETCSGVVD